MNFPHFLISYLKQGYTAGLSLSKFSALNSRQKCLLELEAITSGNLEFVTIERCNLARTFERLNQHSGAYTTQ